MILVIGLGNPGEKYKTTRHNIGFIVLDHFLEKANNLSNTKEVNEQGKMRVTQVGGVPTRAHLSNAREHWREGNLQQDPHITQAGPAEKSTAGPASELTEPAEKLIWKNEYNSEITSLQISGHKILLTKPQTYMNNSGIAVNKLINKFTQNIENLIVIHDDIDLPFGEIKVRKGGGAGGHNGVTSIIENIGKKDFIRIKIGVGRPKKITGDTSGGPPSSARSYEGTRTSDGGGEVTGPIISNYVLQEFTKEEKERLPEIIENASSRLHKLLKFGYEEYASRHNK